MRRTPVRLALMLACVVTCLALPSIGSAATAAPVRDVPSLDPVRTDALWRTLTNRRIEFRPLEAQQCRPLRAVFYAPGDWLRLATTLAAKASPCAQYYISVPPVVADKTRQRPGQAERIRALGPAFHAMAEIHLTSWQKWVAGNGATWYQAGVEARRKMAAAGFDVARGDTWALNEVTSAMRRNDGNQRANLREFLRGLFDAAGEGPPDARRRVRRRYRTAGGGGRDVQGADAGMAPGRRVLVGRQRLRQRLVAGGVWGRPRVRCPGRVDGGTA